MEDKRKFIEEAFELIKKRAHENQTIDNFFTGLCELLKVVEDMAIETLNSEDVLLKDIKDLKIILCNHE